MSTQPVRAVRSPSQMRSKSALYGRWSWHTLQTSGRPGSVRRMRWVSVTMDMICFRRTSSGAKISIVLPMDLLILRIPSVPRTMGDSVCTASGSGKVSP